MKTLLQSAMKRVTKIRWKRTIHSYRHTHPFNGPLSGTTHQVSRYQKVKPMWILLKQETVSGSGICWAQWRRQDLVSGGHEDRGAEGASIEAPKAPSGVGYGDGCPLPSRRAPPAEPRPLSHFLHILGNRTLLVARHNITYSFNNSCQTAGVNQNKTM